MKTLRDVATAVEGRLTAVLAALAVPQLPPTYHYGKDSLHLEEDAPRIVWVPRAGGADGKIMKAPDFPPDFGVAKAPTDFPTPSSLWRRTPTLEAHVWAIRPNPATNFDATKDYVAAELLANHLVAAFHDMMFGSYEMTGENWDAPQANQGAASRRGAVVVLQFRVSMAWAREVDATAVLSAGTSPTGKNGMTVVIGSAHA